MYGYLNFLQSIERGYIESSEDLLMKFQLVLRNEPKLTPLIIETGNGISMISTVIIYPLPLDTKRKYIDWMINTLGFDPVRGTDWGSRNPFYFCFHQPNRLAEAVMLLDLGVPPIAREYCFFSLTELPNPWVQAAVRAPRMINEFVKRGYQPGERILESVERPVNTCNFNTRGRGHEIRSIIFNELFRDVFLSKYIDYILSIHLPLELIIYIKKYIIYGVCKQPHTYTTNE